MNQDNDRGIIPLPIETFKSLLKLLTRDRYEDSEYHKDAKKLQTYHKKKVGEFELHDKVRDILVRVACRRQSL